MQVLNRKKVISYTPAFHGKNAEHGSIHLVSSKDDIDIYDISISGKGLDSPMHLKWKMKALGVKGSWTPSNILDKRFRTDWEMPQLNASISVDAPIFSLFGYEDENIIAIGCSDLINLIPFEGSLREEDNHFYFTLHFVSEPLSTSSYKARIYIDHRKLNFSHVIQDCVAWSVKESGLKIRSAPALAKVPLYSTWYSFHQNLDEEALLSECKLAKDLGHDLVIIDDGWQTMDDNRGYDYTGDWEPLRLQNMEGLVEKVHALGMGIMLWYSVPFCGKKSKAYLEFKGKFLTENHYWAPVFDPRFPEVRAYIVGKYVTALLDWKLDGFKLDFIDEFKAYPDTEIQDLQGRDTLSITEGVQKMILEITHALTSTKPDVLIEFRQKYINPSLRQLGNMFRAFDCPNDSFMNRVRTVDVKLICGEGAAHSDMITWHKEEPIEVSALQYTSLIFSVPQLSVQIVNRSHAEVKMIQFFTAYWKKYAHVLLDGDFTAYKPLSNYPILKASTEDVVIYGLYDDMVLPIEEMPDQVHIINGKLSTEIVLSTSFTAPVARRIFNCLGEEVVNDKLTIGSSFLKWDCPANGIIILDKISA